MTIQPKGVRKTLINSMVKDVRRLHLKTIDAEEQQAVCN